MVKNIYIQKYANSYGFYGEKIDEGDNMKEGYKPFILVNGIPSISITDNGLTFSKSAIVKLGCPAYVNLYIDAEKKMLAVEPGKEGSSQAIAFYRPNDRDIITVRWNNKDLLSYLCAVMNWDLKKYSYKITGTYDYNENFFEFDMKGAEINAKNKQGNYECKTINGIMQDDEWSFEPPDYPTEDPGEEIPF